MESLYKVQEWPDVIAMVQANVKEYEKDFDQPLKKQLENIYVKDQMLRQLGPDVVEKFGKDSDELTYLGELMKNQGSLNRIEVFKIIDKHGWVGTNIVGSRANQGLWLVIIGILKCEL